MIPEMAIAMLKRRLLRVLGDTTTLADADVVQGLRQRYEEREEA
jgi:hypothetical protein